MEQIPDPTTPEGLPVPIGIETSGLSSADDGRRTTDDGPQMAGDASLSVVRGPSSPESGIVRAAAVLAAGNVASRVLGLAREMVKANLFGTS
ncbi:MAG TPA: hypothetical protein PKE20_14580, partial [Promineifilum sp.]|nr:hypothetical protein [Promineifilum sp.]